MELDVTGKTAQIVDGVQEEWKSIDIPEVEGLYEISNYGRVKSKARLDLSGRYRKEKLLTWRRNGGRGKEQPYYHVCLCLGSWQKNFKIHRLVAVAFVEGYFEEATVNHQDGNKANNFYKNLEWMTLKDNCQHRNDNKLLINVKGHAHGRQKLTETEVRFIYTNYMKGLPREAFNAAELGRSYGVHGRAILNIYRKEAWKWLTDEIDKE